MNKKSVSDFVFICSVLLITFLLSCQLKKQAVNSKITVSISMLDSIKKASDSIYTKPYFTRDFVNAEYFVNKKDSTVTQVMKDKDSVIRQVIITKNKIRLFTAQYYANGQLIAKYRLDNFGQYDGYCEEYYQDGHLMRSGIYKSGFHTGKWKNYSLKGDNISIDEYNSDGQLIKTLKNQ